MDIKCYASIIKPHKNKSVCSKPHRITIDASMIKKHIKIVGHMLQGNINCGVHDLKEQKYTDKSIFYQHYDKMTDKSGNQIVKVSVSCFICGTR